MRCGASVVLTALALLVVASCSHSSEKPAVGTISGRMYSDGGPIGNRCPCEEPGDIVARNAKMGRAYALPQTSGGYFTGVVPGVTYTVVGHPRYAIPPFSQKVTVTRDATARVDFGLHAI